MQRKVAGKFRMSSLLACNAKHGFLYLAYQHKDCLLYTSKIRLTSICALKPLRSCISTLWKTVWKKTLGWQRSISFVQRYYLIAASWKSARFPQKKLSRGRMKCLLTVTRRRTVSYTHLQFDFGSAFVFYCEWKDFFSVGGFAVERFGHFQTPCWPRGIPDSRPAPNPLPWPEAAYHPPAARNPETTAPA